MTNLPQFTTVPSVIDALVAAWSLIPAASDTSYGPLRVYDGPVYSEDAHDMIAVAVGDPGVIHQLIPQNRGVAYNESYDIRWMQWSWTGSRDMQQHRNRCFTVVSAMRTAVDGLVIGRATVRFGQDFGWTQSTSGKGACCSVQGTVHVDASL